ncbi:MAG: DNA repair protein RadC [Chloroflexi bacterium]|nr:DNA repair protein RadC [Chloroflexota bacterium]
MRRAIREAARAQPSHDGDRLGTIKSWPVAERPREKLERLGPEQLSHAELLAILLRVGRPGEPVVQLAQRLIVSLGGLTGLVHASTEELTKIDGIGVVKAIELRAMVELARRLMTLAPEQRVNVTRPEHAVPLLQDMQFLTREHLRTVLLNTKGGVLSVTTVYEGSVDRATVRIAEVFREAVRRDCPRIIVAHNHPSGDPTPSHEDVGVTEDLCEAGKLLGIEVLDHLIIGRSGYVSLRQQGLGFRG